MNSSSKISTTYFFLLILLGCFGLVLFSSLKFNYLYWGILIILLFKDGFTANMKETKLGELIIIYISFLFLSCVYSWLFNKQSLYVVIVYSFNYFSILFYFVLLKYKLTAQQTEKIIIWISLSFCMCYIIQWLIYPTILFSSANDTINITDDQFRMRMPGSLGAYILFFMGFNRFIVTKKVTNVIYSLVAMFPILIQGFRSLIALTIIVLFLLIIFASKKINMYAYILVIIMLALPLSSLPIVREKIEEMEQRQINDQTFKNEDYIRYLALDYYWSVQFSKPYEKIVGGGNPVDIRSKYYKTIKNIEKNYNFYWVDLGLVGLSMIIGLPAVVCLVIMYLFCIFKFKEPQYQYVRWGLVVVLIGSIFTSKELFRDGNILLLSLFLYLEYISHHKTSLIVVKKKVQNRFES